MTIRRAAGRPSRRAGTSCFLAIAAFAAEIREGRACNPYSKAVFYVMNRFIKPFSRVTAALQCIEPLATIN